MTKWAFDSVRERDQPLNIPMLNTEQIFIVVHRLTQGLGDGD